MQEIDDPDDRELVVIRLEEGIPAVSVVRQKTTAIAAGRRTGRGGLELRRIAGKIGRPTPVPTVAMDCGPLESRLDRLDAPGLRQLGGRLFEPVVRTSRFD